MSVAPEVLEGRYARCTCGAIALSSTSLAFFEFRGEGSRSATDICRNCGYARVAHEQDDTRTQMNVVERGKCPGFESGGPWQYDSWYCGHAGWD